MNLLIIGARIDGHAGVILDTISLLEEYTVVGFLVHDKNDDGKIIEGYPVYGGDDQLRDLAEKYHPLHAIVAIGDNHVRQKYAALMSSCSVTPQTVIHPSATISKSTTIGHGSFIAAGVVIQYGARIGDHVVVNTSASVDHNCVLENFSFIGPGCHLCGRVTLQEMAFIGAGTTIVPDVSIGTNTIVGAGSLVLKNIPDNKKCFGVPVNII